jgi:hypothetical protein
MIDFLQQVLRLAIRSFVENHDARTDEFCAPSENPTSLDLFGNGAETKPIVQRFGNPALSLGDVAKVNTAMAIRYGVIVAPIGGLADKFECFARSDMFIGIIASVDASGRFAP